VWRVRALLTKTCHVSEYPWQLTLDTWILWSGFILHLCNLVATLHESHTTHFYYETQSRSFMSVCLLKCSLWSLLLWILLCSHADWPYSPISPLWLLVLTGVTPWSRFLSYRLSDTLSKDSQRWLAYPLLRELNSLPSRCLGNDHILLLFRF
jgi:hypothetical protein